MCGARGLQDVQKYQNSRRMLLTMKANRVQRKTRNAWHHQGTWNEETFEGEEKVSLVEKAWQGIKA